MLTQFGQIHIVDLDTVTLSNLNRQFLFRLKDIEKSKSLTIAKSVQSFNYANCKLTPHHGNIMDSNMFPISWWEEFDYVYNALDNLEARRFVNKMCLLLSKPLMESGTTGYDGQIQPIYPYCSECFDCQAKGTPKTYPICTIRSTPSQPVHCITWAKEFLFTQLFDDSSTTMSSNDVESQQKKAIEEETDDKMEIEAMMKETNELLQLRTLINHLRLENRNRFIQELIKKIFSHDILRLLSIETLWTYREKPEPLDFEKYMSDLDTLVQSNDSDKLLNEDTKVWSTLENLFVLYRSSQNLQNRLNALEAAISFDKDDEDTLNFVAAASNLRCINFHIEPQSKFDIKQIAGNIIPAIATTNAIISGFSCLSSLRYFDPKFSGDMKKVAKESSSVFISIKPNKYVTGASLVDPNPNCPVCSFARGIVRLNSEDLKTLTLDDFLGTIRKKYHYEGDISIVLDDSKLIYDFDFEDNLENKLEDIEAFKNGGIIIQDEEDKLENLDLFIQITKEPLKFPDVILRPKRTVEEHPDASNPGNADLTLQEESILIDDAIEFDRGNNGEPALKKRKA